jgi:uncharacterized repeat protein (TIGR03803 family)
MKSTNNQSMKTPMNNLLLLPALIATLNMLPAGRVSAQTFTTLHSFTARSFPDFTGTNSDGALSYASLITNSSGNTLYGTASQGGSSGRGTVFAVNTDGSGLTNLYSFTALSGGTSGPNGDGAGPTAGLILSGNTLYGTARIGGSSGVGTVFAVNTDGTGFTNLHSFTGSDGANPYARLILSGSTLYGTAQQGGNLSAGTVFAVSTDGTIFTNLHSFTGSDGGSPFAGLILSGNTLYGTAWSGGSSGAGTVFALNTNGTGFTNLHSFSAAPPYPDNTNSDGFRPEAGLILSGNTLYGTAQQGGSSGRGTLFAVNTDGTAFTNLHSFNGGSDGWGPVAELILSGSTLYGTALQGGSWGYGTVFAVNTNGTGFTTLYSFTAISCFNCPNSDGANPRAGLILSGSTLYGTAYGGGSAGNGTVFSLSFRPQLTITPSGTNVILSWPISYAGFSYGGYFLQETANLVSQGGWISVVDTNPPVIVNGQLQVTRPMLGPQWSYRLRKF